MLDHHSYSVELLKLVQLLPRSTKSVTELFNETFTLAIFLNKRHQESETIKQAPQLIILHIPLLSL